MAIRLIGIDLDGTLLDSTGNIPEENRLAMRYAREKGAMPVICTGRMYATARRVCELLELDTPMVVCNGAEARDHGAAVLYRSLLHIDDVAWGLEIANRFALHPIISEGELMYLKNASREAVNEIYGGTFDEFDHFVYRENDDALLQISREAGAVKLVFTSMDTAALNEARALLQSQGQARYAVTSSWLRSMDMISMESSKGTGLLWLAGQYGVHPDEIMAIGDHENDISMLEIAGTPVAMGNADEAVKAVASFTTLTNDECGFAAAIRKIMA